MAKKPSSSSKPQKKKPAFPSASVIKEPKMATMENLMPKKGRK